MNKDYYEILGVSKDATETDIRKAYRKLAHKYHPDTGKGDEAKFKEANEAYNVLGNKDKRARYDQFGSAGVETPNGYPGGGGFNVEDIGDIFSGFDDFGDIFSDIFGGRRRPAREQGVHVEVATTISLKEAFNGVEKEISLNKNDTCSECDGSGAAPGHKVITCPRCHGQGQIRSTQQTIFGRMAVSTTCERCQGTGQVPEKECKKCQGTGRVKQSRKIKVKIPAGVSDNSRIKIAGEGEVGYRGSASGDLYIRVNVEPDSRFQRSGQDIKSEVKISFIDAVLGQKVKVDTLAGRVDLKIPAGTQTGTVFRLKGKGMPKVGGFGHGDHYVEATVDIPVKLNKKQKELLEKYRQALD